jgi:hypothetical protein
MRMVVIAIAERATQFGIGDKADSHLNGLYGIGGSGRVVDGGSVRW